MTMTINIGIMKAHLFVYLENILFPIGFTTEIINWF